MPEAIVPAAPAAASPSTPAPETAKSAPAAATESSGGSSARNEKGQFQTAAKTRDKVDKRPDKETIYAKVRANLDKFNEAGSDQPKDTDTETEPEAQSAASSEPPAAGSNATAEQAAKDAGSRPAKPGEKPAVEPEADETATEAAADVTPAPTLPAAHVRSLKAFGLSDAEIAKTSPEVAAALHTRRNQEITRWAQQGRQQQVPTQPAPVAPPAGPLNPAPAPASPPPPAARPTAPAIDIAALKATYGDEPLIAALEQQQKALEQSHAFQARYEAELAQRQAAAQQQQLETLGKQVDQFFSAKELAPYHAAYGTDSRTATAEQFAKREEVLKRADATIGWARQNGENLSVADALQQAFDSVSAPLAKEAARQEIRSELQKRSRGMSLKPGGKPTPKAATSNKAELEAKTRTALRNVFS